MNDAPGESGRSGAGAGVPEHCRSAAAAARSGRFPTRRGAVRLLGAGTGLASSFLVAGCASGPATPAPRPTDPIGLLLDGISEQPGDPGDWSVVPPDSGLSFIPDTSVLAAGPSGSAATESATPGRSAAPPAASLAVSPAAAAARAWLAAGTVPGPGPLRDLAVRALLDLRLAVQPNGAMPAAPLSIWNLVWPRDASWAAAGLAVTGHADDAERVLRFLARVQRADGTWAARTLVDGSGRVPDKRADQIDAVGWFCWALWLWRRTRTSGGPGAVAPLPDDLWKTARAAANAAVRALGPDGLPEPSCDYWELRPAVTIGNAAVLSAGLRAAADLAGPAGDTPSADAWATAADSLDRAVTRDFGPAGFRRTPNGTIVDAAVAWLAPPFAEPDRAVAAAIAQAAQTLAVLGDGIVPGLPAPGPVGEAWTPETAMFALCEASAGAADRARARLAWLAAHRTGLGSLPERVGVDGKPISVAPLAWTNGAVLLALSALDRPLPIPGRD